LTTQDTLDPKSQLIQTHEATIIELRQDLYNTTVVATETWEEKD